TMALHSLVPIWSPVRVDTSQRIVVPESSAVLLLGADQTRLDWLRACCPSATRLESVSAANVDEMARTLADASFEQLLWVAPDVDSTGEDRSDRDRII